VQWGGNAFPTPFLVWERVPHFFALFCTKGEHGFGFKSGGFLTFSWIWFGFCKFCFTGFGFGFDNLVLNFFATFSAVLRAVDYCN